MGESSDADDRHLELRELIVRPKREKYSKKNNPAVDFVRKVMERRHLTDPKTNNPYYNHDLYERINIGIINFPIDSAGALSFLHQYVDTTELTGRPVLNLTVKEKLSDVHYQRDPEMRREVVRLRNRHGLDDMLGDAASIQTVFEEFMRPVDLYEGDNVTLLRQKFVSPLGRLAPDVYRFYLTDTIADNERGDSLIVLSFVPHNPTTPGFNGRIYVVKGDSTMFIRRAEMRLPKDANVNFIRDMFLVQEYDAGSDGSRLKTRDEVIIEAHYAGVDAYATRFSMLSNHNYRQPGDSTIFASQREIIERCDLNPDEVDFRRGNMPSGAGKMASMMEQLRSKKVYYWAEKVASTLIADYLRPGGEKAKVAFGPIFSTVSRDALEGWRLRLGAMTTANLSRRWFASAYGAYGFRDHKAKYGASLEYSFINKQFHPREFPIRSLKVSHSYDTDRIGQAYAEQGTIWNAITRGKDDLMTYRRLTSVAFNYETERHLNFSLGLLNSRQEATPFVRFVTGNGQRFSHFDQTSAVFDFTWAPGEKYYQSINGRKRLATTNPVLRLTHTWAPAGLLGSTWGVNKTEMMIDKRWYFSAWGHIDARLGGGHVWDRTVFPSLFVPNVNLSYFIDPRAFALMNDMEFVNDSYVELHMTYNANGALLNYIPIINKLKLREIVGFHAIWGHLSRKNDPTCNPDLLMFPESAATKPMGRVPYMEFHVGLGNILRFLNVQYVHRLTHRGPGLPKNGVRIGFHFSF